VFKVWSAEELPGLMQAIMIILILSDFSTKESLSTMVSLEALKGMWMSGFVFFMSRLRMHSFRARRDLLISAPSNLLCLLLL